MSVRLMSRVWELDLAQNEKLILLAFADHANDDGLTFPSVARVAWKCGYSERQTRAIVSALRRRNLLEAVGNSNGGRGLATAYYIHPENHAKLAPFCKAVAERLETLRNPAQNPANPPTERSAIHKEPSLTTNQPLSRYAPKKPIATKGGHNRAEQRTRNNLTAAGF